MFLYTQTASNNCYPSVQIKYVYDQIEITSSFLLQTRRLAIFERECKETWDKWN